MVMHTITVQIPESLFATLRTLAASNQRTIEEQVIAGLERSLGEAPALDSQLPIDELPDEQLWRLAETPYSDASSKRAEELSDKQQAAGLTAVERAELMELVDDTDTYVLRRAQALAALVKRGIDISPLLQPVSQSG